MTTKEQERKALEQIKANADRLGISVSAYVRMVVIKELEVEKK